MYNNAVDVSISKLISSMLSLSNKEHEPWIFSLAHNQKTKKQKTKYR